VQGAAANRQQAAGPGPGGRALGTRMVAAAGEVRKARQSVRSWRDGPAARSPFWQRRQHRQVGGLRLG